MWWWTKSPFTDFLWRSWPISGGNIWVHLPVLPVDPLSHRDRKCDASPLHYGQVKPGTASDGRGDPGEDGAEGKGKRLPDQLSGGEQERVAIARALVNSPPILLADEPTGNLDSKTGKEIMELFKTLNKEGQTIIMVTHNPENTAFSTRTIFLKDGRVKDGPWA